MSATIPRDLLLAERIWRLYTGEEPERADAGNLLEATRWIANHNLDGASEKNMALSAMRAAMDGANQQYLVELEALQAQVRVLREALVGLMEEQNGPPLLAREEEWNNAMAAANAAVLAVEGTK